MKVFHALLSILCLAAACEQVAPFETEPWPEKEEEGKPKADLSGYFRLTAENGNNAVFSLDEETGEYTVSIGGEGAFLYTEPLTRTIPADSCYLTFEYKAAEDMEGMQVFLAYPVNDERSIDLGPLPATETWSKIERDLRPERTGLPWGSAGDAMRLDFRTSSGNTLQIRKLYIRAQTEAERKAEIAASEAAEWKAQTAALLEAYLGGKYAGTIDKVSVGKEVITVSGTAPLPDCSLAEILPWENLPRMQSFPHRHAIAAEGAFTISLPRRTVRNGTTDDALLSRWVIIHRDENGWHPVSSARYPDEVEAEYRPAPLPIRNKKGIGGMRANETFYDDMDQMDAGIVTLNITLDNLIGTVPFSSDIPYEYKGTTYHINQRQVAVYDTRLTECAKRNTVAFGVILVGGNPSDPAMKPLLTHPDADPGSRYVMPNLTSREGVGAYTAALDYLARRYDGEQSGMRISHWIIHNEVDFAKSWTNMGDQPLSLYMDSYAKSMRLCRLIVSQYNPDAWVLVSLTHCWTATDGEYAPRDLLEQLLLQSAVEGDFRWGVAPHPYPENLYLPAFWQNDTRSTWSADTPYITFRNLEVWDAWILSPDHLFNGTEKRLLVLSENGTASPSYSETDLALQAAGAAWAWKKTEALEGIDAIAWHNWMDTEGEGTLIGLRFPADYAASPGGAKPVWQVWQAAGSNREDETFAPYLPVIGLSSWDGIFHPVGQ